MFSIYFSVLQPLDVLVDPVLPRELVGAREVVHPLVGQKSLGGKYKKIKLLYGRYNVVAYLESVRLRVHSRPHEVEVRVGGVDLVEAVGVADGAGERRRRKMSLASQK